MYKGKKILAVIPARGGSKGVPGKNIRELAGKPLIAWSIEAGKKSRYLDDLIISTDSEEIGQTAIQWGGSVPFLRPAELSTDTAKGIDAILHAITWQREHGNHFDLVLVLQPTSPLRTATDIDQAIELFFDRGAKAVVSVCQTGHHPWWSNTLPEDRHMENFLRPEIQNTNRQSLPACYRLNGAIYLADIPHLEKKRSFLGKGTYATIMDEENSVDIDTLLDFKFADVLLSERKDS